MAFEKPPVRAEDAPREHGAVEKRRKLDSQAMELTAASWRKKLFERFRSDEAGINTGRCRDFIKSMELPLKELLILKEEQREEFVQAVRDLSVIFDKFTLSPGEEDIRGIYNANLDMIVIFRQPEHDRSQTPLEEEAMIVHEMAHATSSHPLLLDEVATKARAGLSPYKVPPNKEGQRVYTKVGTFLEEGYAEMMGRKYMRQFRTTEEKQKILDAFEKASGEKGAQIDEVVSMGFENPDYGVHEPITFQLPLDHLRVKSDGSLVDANMRVYQAYALEMLCREIPGLEKSLHESRTSVQGLRDVSHLIEGFEPGLYRALRDIEDFDMKGILEGLNKVRSLVEKRREEKKIAETSK